MSVIGNQLVRIFRRSDNEESYNFTIDRDILLYPLTDAGQAAYETQVALGNHGGIILDNGAVIADGTPPPLVKPSNPTYAPLYEQTVNGDGRFIRPATDSPAVSISYGFTGATIEDDNYDLQLIYQSNVGSPGHGRVTVNGTALSPDFATEVADGGTRTLHFTIAFQVGANTILLSHVDGIWYEPKSLTVTRAATA